jgi:hypothetical protein
MGGTGTGKSRFLEGLLAMDALRRLRGASPRGVVQIDVHGDLYRNSRSRLAVIAQYFPMLYRLLYLFDVTRPDWTVRWNPLEIALPDELPEERAGKLADVVSTVYHDDPTTTNRMRWLLWHLFMALILAGLDLTDSLTFLRDREYREGLIEDLHYPELTGYWVEEFPSRHSEGMAWAESTLDRLGRFVTHPYVSELLRGPSTLNWRQLMDQGAFVLIHAPKGKLGAEVSYLVCGLALAEMQNAALSRVDVPESERTPVSVQADEFANYITDSIREIIVESRKLGLELILAGQELNQLRMRGESLYRAVLGSVGNLIAFRLGREDAEVLVKHLFTPPVDQVKHQQVKSSTWGKLIVPYTDYTWRPLAEIWELETQKLTELPDRMFYWKRRGHAGSQLLRTSTVRDLEDMPDFDRLPGLLDRQEEAARRLSGQPRIPKLPARTIQRERSIAQPAVSRGSLFEKEVPPIWGW